MAHNLYSGFAIQNTFMWIQGYASITEHKYAPIFRANML